MVIYAYGGKTAEIWWDKIKISIMRFDNLQVVNFSDSDTAALAKLANRAMKLQINIQDGDVMVSVGDTIVNVTVTQEWWAVCMPCQAPLATRKEGEWWAEMPEIFHLD